MIAIVQWVLIEALVLLLGVLSFRAFRLQSRINDRFDALKEVCDRITEVLDRFPPATADREEDEARCPKPPIA